MFSYFHLNNNGASWLSTVHLFVFGLFTAVYALKRGNIWGPCGFHFAWNFIMGEMSTASMSAALIVNPL
ncbi:MAG: CPBP family intramembrane glutamic endopeptidase [Streptococcus sp.]